MPILSPESIDGRQVLVIWVPASDIRPHQAPISLKAGERTYYVRPGSDSIVAKGVLLTDLLNLSNKVPFDDRLNRGFSVSDIRAGLVREFLANVGSGLLSETSEQTVYTQMRLIQPINSHEAPRNVALLFFSENPEKSFQGARIEVVHFVDETGGSVLEEKIFRGPLDRQIRDCLSYLGNLSSLHLRKSDAVFETAGYVGFPLSSLKEAVVNAVYHRGYDNPEPTKIYLYPDRLEIISYPGPVSGLKPEFLLSGAKVPPFPSRNRRIGEFLKELRLAEARGTGLPTIFRTMASNGSPLPTFDFDDDRTYFRATLPAHPEYVALAALRESAQLDATGNPEKALERLESAHQKLPGSGSLTAKLIEAYCAHEKFSKARAVYESFRTQTPRTSEAKVVATLSRCYLSAGLEREAREVLEHLKLVSSAHDAIELAILERRARREDKAHRLFQRAEGSDALLSDPKALHEFAQCKLNLARKAHKTGQHRQHGRQVNKRLLGEARELIDRVLQLEAHAIRHARAWTDLAQILHYLREPKDQIFAALDRAVEMAPDDHLICERADQIRRSATDSL